MEPQSYYYMHPIQPEWLPRGLLGTLIAARCVSYVRVYQKGPLLRDQCLFFLCGDKEPPLLLLLLGWRMKAGRTRVLSARLIKRSSHQWRGSGTEPDRESLHVRRVIHEDTQPSPRHVFGACGEAIASQLSQRLFFFSFFFSLKCSVILFF